MLKKLRERKTIKLIMFITAILVLPAFVLWGVGSALRTRGTSNIAGVVFSKKITKDEFLKQYQAVYNQAQLLYGENVSKLLDYLNLEGQTWQRIILLQEAGRNKVKVANEEIISSIRNAPLFQKKDKFDTATYDTILKYYMGINPREYEEQVRNSLKIKKLLDKAASGINAAAEEAWEEYKKGNTTYKLSYIPLKPSDYYADTKYTEEELSSFYQANKEQFKKPEQANIIYLAVKPEPFIKDVNITDAEIQDYYQQHKSEFKKDTKEGVDEESDTISDETKGKISEALKKTAAKNIAEDLIWKVQDKIDSGLTLKEAAAENKLKVSETGFFSPWDPIPGIGWAYKITQTAFSFSPGKTSDIIEAQNAFYIIQLKEKKAPYIPEFNEIKTKVEESFKNNQAEEIAKKDAQKKLDEMIELSAAKGDIDKFLKEHNLSFKQTDYLTRSAYIAQIGNASDIIDSLKADTAGDFNPEVIKCTAGYLIVRIEEVKEAVKEDFEKDKKQFIEKLLDEKKKQHLNDWFNQLKEQADLEIYFKMPRQ